MNNAEVTMVMYFAEVITGENMTDRVQQLQLSALQELRSQLQYYRSRGIAEKLISTIAEKKGRLILKTTSKAEMDRVLRPGPPHYNGAEFVPAANSIPEEELICWSETSMRTPLNSAGYRRYFALFKQIFPDEVIE